VAEAGPRTLCSVVKRQVADDDQGPPRVVYDHVRSQMDSEDEMPGSQIGTVPITVFSPAGSQIGADSIAPDRSA
jgi:hypothetical protein